MWDFKVEIELTYKIKIMYSGQHVAKHVRSTFFCVQFVFSPAISLFILIESKKWWNNSKNYHFA